MSGEPGENGERPQGTRPPAREESETMRRLREAVRQVNGQSAANAAGKGGRRW